MSSPFKAFYNAAPFQSPFHPHAIFGTIMFVIKRDENCGRIWKASVSITVPDPQKWEQIESVLREKINGDENFVSA
jgi:hypothetical protein